MAPTAPLKQVMPISPPGIPAPSCPDRRITLSVWSLRNGERVASTSFVPPDDPTGLAHYIASTGLAPYIASITMGPRNSARITLDEIDPPVVQFDSVNSRVVQGDEG
jgi:hypothetical protein